MTNPETREDATETKTTSREDVSACCSTSEQATCCAPSDKPTCCGTTEPSKQAPARCGCR